MSEQSQGSEQTTSTPATERSTFGRTITEKISGLLIGVGALVAVVASIIVIRGTANPGQAMEKLKLATGYALLVFLFFLSLAVLLEIANGKIDLSELLEELSGGASLSRFQLLIFTFVIAFSVFIVVANNNDLPDIPTGVLVLLGVSAGTYGVSKGLQVTSGDKLPPVEANKDEKKPNP